jgi:hypothetical protein
MEERLAAVLAKRLGTDTRCDPTPALLAFVARALMDTAFNVWFDQQPADAGAMVDDLFRRLRAVVAGRGARSSPAGRPAAARRAKAVRQGAA